MRGLRWLFLLIVVSTAAFPTGRGPATNGKPATVALPNGLSRHFTYDGADRISTQTDVLNGSVVAAFGVHDDDA